MSDLVVPLSAKRDNKSLVTLTAEELATSYTALRGSGVSFARTENRPKKDAARQLILDLFNQEKWPDYLRILTMPGISWRFERLLLASREEAWARRAHPRRTMIVSAENNRAAFFAAAHQMPGLHNQDPLVKWNGKYKYNFAESRVKTHWASLFFANIYDLMQFNGWTSKSRGTWDAAWLDFTGPLSINTLPIIENFYQNRIKGILVVTAMMARWDNPTSAAIKAAGGHSQLLQARLDGDILHDIEYMDTVPMAQFAIRKKKSLWFWD